MNNPKKISAAAVLALSLFLGASTSSRAIANVDKRKGRAVKSPSSRQLTRAEVKQAEGRLSEMGYGTGRVDGEIDNVTRNAVIAFQKWEGRKVSGRLSRDDFDAILSANAPEARDAGYRHVEVDIDRQVLLLTDDDGAVIRVLPISSGSNKQYKEKTMSGLAYTPRGRFRIIAEDFRLAEVTAGIALLPELLQRRRGDSRKSFSASRA